MLFVSIHFLNICTILLCGAFITLSPIGAWSIVMSMSVCVCLSDCDHIFGTTRPIFTNFLSMFLMAVAQSSSGGVVMSYVLPVLWMTPCWLISQGCSCRHPSEAQHTCSLGLGYKLHSIPVAGQRPTDAWDYFLGVELAVYNCLVIQFDSITLYELVHSFALCVNYALCLCTCVRKPMLHILNVGSVFLCPLCWYK